MYTALSIGDSPNPVIAVQIILEEHMKKKFTGFIAIVMAASLIFSLTACGKDEKESDTTTAAATTAADDTTATVVTTPGETTTAVDATTAAGDTTAVGETTAAGVAKIPSTLADIVSYYNNSANKVKPQAKSIVQNYERNRPIGDVDVGNNKTLTSIGTRLVNANMGDIKDKKGVVSTSQADKNANFPVEGQAWTSKLTPAMVDSAKCVEGNGQYIITIILKDEPAPNPSAGKGYAGNAFSVISKEKIVDGAGSAMTLARIQEDSIKIIYTDCKIVAKIDPATGNMVYANYDMPLRLYITALGIDVSVGFAVEKDFTITW